MRLAVLIKYVPSDLLAGADEKNGGVRRSADNSVMNQADVFALEAAVKLKKMLGGVIDVYTMGPDFAKDMLRSAAALGADGLTLLTDRSFAGGDSFATARVLSTALAGGGYDLILCGERTVDGETGQVPGEISAMLDVPYVTGITAIDGVDDNKIRIIRMTDTGEELVAMPLPGVLGISCGMRDVSHPLAPSLSGLGRARSAEIIVLDAKKLGIPPEEAGERGSKTAVRRMTAPDWTRHCVMADSLPDGVAGTLEALHG